MTIDPIELTEMQSPGKNANAPKLLSDNYGVIKNIKVNLDVTLGHSELSVEELFNLKKDSVVKLDRDINGLVDILLDGNLVAQGELVVVDDNFGVKIQHIAAQ